MPRKLLSNYGMIVVLNKQFGRSQIIVTAGATNTDSSSFAEDIGNVLMEQGYSNCYVVIGFPRELRLELDKIRYADKNVAAIITTGDAAKWRLITSITELYPDFADSQILVPETRIWQDFLKRSNLLAIVDRIVVIALWLSV